MTVLSRAVVGEVMRDVRLLQELPQKALAHSLELTQASVSKLEMGKAPVSLENFVKWCYECGKSPTEVLDEIIRISTTRPTVVVVKGSSSELDGLDQDPFL